METSTLLMLLAQQAPVLLKALQTPYNHPGDWTDGESPLDPMFGNDALLEEYIGNRGYDPGLLEDATKGWHAQLGTSPSARYVRMNDAAASALQDLDISDNADSINNKLVPSDVDPSYSYAKDVAQLPPALQSATVLAPDSNEIKELYRRLHLNKSGAYGW